VAAAERHQAVDQPGGDDEGDQMQQRGARALGVARAASARAGIVTEMPPRMSPSL
jgi:hypothetical protein